MTFKNLTLLLIGIILINTLNAQNIIRQSLSSLGSNNMFDGILLRQTIGQPSNTTCFSSENNTIRQGFQQPVNNINAKIYSNKKIELSLYPNPINDYFQIKIVGDDISYSILVTDILGNTISTLNIAGNNESKIKCDNWGTGIYFINIYSNNNLQITKKIVKI
ncbi:MAG: T9SS type A sorting domain-containing protein [Bacteroidia bacterium]|nr:T9SS type A sorting domain-containing protein [Bacteroidia bacterium]